MLQSVFFPLALSLFAAGVVGAVVAFVFVDRSRGLKPSEYLRFETPFTKLSTVVFLCFVRLWNPFVVR